MIDHMIEGLTRDGDAQVRHVDEVGRTESTGIVDLCEEHLLGRTGWCSPPVNPSL